MRKEGEERRWIIPANPNIYDIVGAFTDESLKQNGIPWHQGKKTFEVGQIVYVYASKDIQRVLFKCKIIRVDQKNGEEDREYWIDEEAVRKEMKGQTMYLKPIARYKIENEILPLSNADLTHNGLGNGEIQGPRYSPPKLLDHIEYVFDHSPNVESLIENKKEDKK